LYYPNRRQLSPVLGLLINTLRCKNAGTAQS
jgi:hypothetical protein